MARFSFEADKNTADAVIKAIADLIEAEAPIFNDEMREKFPAVLEMIGQRHAALRRVSAELDRQAHPAPAQYVDMREVSGPGYLHG